MISEYTLETKAGSNTDGLQAECGECTVAVDYLYLLSDEDVPQDWNETDNTRKYYLLEGTL